MFEEKETLGLCPDPRNGASIYIIPVIKGDLILSIWFLVPT